MARRTSLISIGNESVSDRFVEIHHGVLSLGLCQAGSTCPPNAKQQLTGCGLCLGLHYECLLLEIGPKNVQIYKMYIFI